MTTYPPDGYEISGSSTWADDFAQNDSVVYDGEFSVEFKNTTPASDPTLLSDVQPVEPGSPYLARAIIRADSIAGTSWVSFYVHWYTSAGVYISAVSIYTAALPSVDTWYELSGIVTAPANAGFAKKLIRKNNVAFTAYFSSASIVSQPIAFHAYLASNQTITGGVWAIVANATEVHDYGSVYDNSAGNYSFTAPSNGLYSFSGSVWYATGTPDGTQLQAALYKNGVIWFGAANTMGSSTATSVPVTAPDVYLLRGDVIDFRTTHNYVGGTGTATIIASVAHTYFFGSKS